jgi:glycine/D-amino acid oxidase-like deaminating enzyme
VRLAAFCPIDGFANAYLTGLAYRQALVAAGVQVLEHRPVVGLEPAGTGFRVHGLGFDIRASRVVLAGGVWLEPMLRWFGIDLPVKVLVNQLAITERLAPVLRTVLTVASGLLSLKQFANGTVLVGGGWQGRGDREQVTGTLMTENLLGNLRLAAFALPALRNGRLVRAWLGLEAETADAMPAIGPVPGTPGAYVIGSVHSGYTSGPYMGLLLADLILGRTPERPLFPIDRLLATARGPATEVAAQ